MSSLESNYPPEIVNQVIERVPAWRDQLHDMEEQMKQWGMASTHAKNVERGLYSLSCALVRLAEGMRFHNPYYEHDLKMKRARETARRHRAESLARRAKAEAARAGGA